MDIKTREDYLRRTAKKLGVGVRKRFNVTFGEDGYMLFDVAGNYVLAGEYPVLYSLTLEEAEAFIKNYAAEEGA